MLGLIIETVVAMALTLLTIDLLQNSEIFDNKTLGLGNGRLSPHEHIEALSCETEVEITDKDNERVAQAVVGIQAIIGNDPVERLSEMDATERFHAAQAIHQALCTAFSMDIGLKMGTSDDGICGFYRHIDKEIWVDYRYLLSTNPEHIEEYLDTIFHEFRHAMQMKFIENAAYNDASEPYRMRMACSLYPDVYVNFSQNPELYYKQLCERDARAFATLFISTLKGEK